MKQLKPEAEAVLRDLFEKVPGIRNFAAVKAESSAMRGELSLYDGKTLQIHAVLLDRATPKTVAERIAGLNGEMGYPIIMAPYISEASANLCEAAGIGFCDYSGNCLIRFHTLYISSKGNPNRYPAKDHAKTLFSPSAQTTSRILRELMKDVSGTWKLKTLSETVGCSIGMVSRVKTFLCEQCWAVMDSAGLRLTDPESLLKEWSRAYSVGSTVSCYTLDSLPDFEEKCFRAYQDGLELCMTGISGGVRYAPVVRYSKAHIWIRPQDVTFFFQKTGCREVDSGANIVLYLAPGDEVFADSREVNGSRVASPVQVYLDCMQIKGRGEEMAEAVYAKEIRK